MIFFLSRFQKSRFVKNVAVLQAGSFTGTLIQAVAGVLIARLLQPELFGIYSLAFGMASVTTLIIGMGIQEAVSSLMGRAYAEGDKNKIEEILGFMLKITFFAALVVIVFSALLPQVSQRLYGDSLIGIYAAIVSVAVMLSSFFFALTYSVWQVTGKIKQLTYLITGDQSFRSILSFILVFTGLGVLGAVGGHLIGASIIFILSAILFKRSKKNDLLLPGIRDLLRSVRKVELKKYFGFTFWVALDRNMGNLYMALPVILTGIYVSASQVSFFKLAFGYINIALSLLGPISVLLNVEFPKLQVESVEKMARSFVKVSLYSLGISSILTLGAVLISPFAFRILYGESFLPSVQYVFGLVIYGALFGIGVALGPMWRAINKVKVSILINLIILGIGIPLGLLLIRELGLWGAVIMVTLWFTFSHLISFAYLVRRIKKISIAA